MIHPLRIEGFPYDLVVTHDTALFIAQKPGKTNEIVISAELPYHESLVLDLRLDNTTVVGFAGKKTHAIELHFIIRNTNEVVGVVYGFTPEHRKGVYRRAVVFNPNFVNDVINLRNELFPQWQISDSITHRNPNGLATWLQIEKDRLVPHPFFTDHFNFKPSDAVYPTTMPEHLTSVINLTV